MILILGSPSCPKNYTNPFGVSDVMSLSPFSCYTNNEKVGKYLEKMGYKDIGAIEVDKDMCGPHVLVKHFMGQAAPDFVQRSGKGSR